MNKFYSIRPVEQPDLTAWSRLRTELWPDTTDQHKSELQQFFAGNSIDIVQTFVACREDDTVIGFIELNIRNFAEGSRQPEIPYVEGWYVDRDHRGAGLGRALMQRAETWAVELGFNELASDTEIDNQRSASIHQHLGFKEVERVVCFIKQLDRE